ncbi:aminotransferase class III-fold pyridoxal phosphate-dependent enzyme [Nocardia terpenica]|uniref:Aminotransferase class III-fold pyridoxal phosphate-dependent enzyme n=1 Tax=Nocardia terpenica TaxID=455432 RepID=A0A6G9ZE43_9NOCA|nr:aminotransferase class III-fold pyridoxal phosphate-dependent enzyme [Nocardia terpenica]QIS23710.1 aminotransferase class III-fold pyridoxal phosphate-dependent enzyme [Nocardia terpenica]
MDQHPVLGASRWAGWSTSQHPPQPRLILERGRGCEVWDVDGNRYLDGIASSGGSHIFGHAHPDLVDAVTNQAEQLAHFDETIAGQQPAEALMDDLCTITGMDEFVLVNDGSGAVEAAIRVVVEYWIRREQPQRDTIIAFERGYHGCTALAQSLSGLPHLRRGRAGGNPRVRHVRLAPHHHPGRAGAATALATDFADAIEAADPARVAAVIVEPFLYTGGGIVLPPEFLSELRTVTTRADCLLIVDEAFTGFGRAGTAFAIDSMHEPPDILVIGNGMTGGVVPMSAVCVEKRIRDAFGDARLPYGHTTGGHGVGCAAALATIGMLHGFGITAAQTAARWFADTFCPRFAHLPGVVEARSYGVTGVVECDTADRAETITATAREHGLIVGREGSSLMLTPALNTTETDLDKMATLLHTAITGADVGPGTGTTRS